MKERNAMRIMMVYGSSLVIASVIYWAIAYFLSTMASI